MKAFPHYALCAAVVAAAQSLTGCATPTTPAADLPALGAASTADTDQYVEITGSRIPVRRTEKMVSQIGGKDYKENKMGLVAPLEAR